VGRLVKHFGARGVDVQTRSESPVGAGIAGSSAMAVAVTGALSAWAGRTMEPEELLTVAMNIEAQVIGVPAGVQDYRPAMYGGVSAIELGVTGVRRSALSIDPHELGRRVVLAYTGASRQSGINNWNVMMRRINGDPAVIAAFDGIRDAAAGVRNALERHNWKDLATHIGAEWEHRKQLAPAVTTPEIDGMLARAHEAGATAACSALLSPTARTPSPRPWRAWAHRCCR
jgi:D-glycero-alpha-D-manno-heptose-7-phosphate kinase